jgi:hypothetical protein
MRKNRFAPGPAEPLSISGTPTTLIVEGEDYSFTPDVTGGEEPYTFSYTGTLLAGWAFNTSTGALTKTAAVAGTCEDIIITVTDNNNDTDSLVAFDVEVVEEGGAEGIEVTMRSTAKATVDVSTLLADLDDTTLVTLTVDGPISARVWLRYDHADTELGIYYKRELLDNLTAMTNGATEGTAVGTWTIEWPGHSHTVTFDIDDTPPTSYRIGQDTLAMCGGYPIHKYLPDVGGWSLLTQSTANAFQIVDADHATPSLATKRYVTFKGSFYANPTRSIGTPTAGIGAYTVTLTHATHGTFVISFDVIPGLWNVAVNARNDSFANGTQLSRTMNRSNLAIGDTVLLGDGVHVSGFNNPCTPATSTRMERGEGYPITPTSPYENTRAGIAPEGWNPDGFSWAQGWITVTPEEPYAARIGTVDGSQFSINTSSLNNNGLFLRFTKFAGLNMFTTNNTSCRWLAVDHCEDLGQSTLVGAGTNATVNFSTNSGTNKNIFYLCNDYTIIGTGGRGQDCQVVGNRFTEITNNADMFQGFVWNSVTGEKKSMIAFNFLRGMTWDDALAHPDAIQFNSTGADVYNNATPGTTFEMAYMFGNAFCRGNVSDQAGTGLAELAFQGFFLRNLDTQNIHIWKVCGNVVVSNYTNGAVFGAYDDTHTLCQYNTFVLVNQAGVAGGAPGIFMRDTTNNLTVKHCLLAGNFGFADDSNPDPTIGAIVTNSLDRIYSAGGDEDPADVWVDPTAGEGIVNLDTLIAGLTPKPNGPATVEGGASEIMGAIGHDKINFRSWAYDTAIFTA